MPFKPRELYPGQYYHIIIQSNNHACVFKDDQDFKKFLILIKEEFAWAQVRIFHYVLMNTHVHMIVQLPDEGEDAEVDEIKYFPEAIKTILLKYYYFYKFKYSWDGSLWRKRYKAELLDTERYMLGCGLYIEYNPVKAGMVKKPEDYHWSSYEHWIGKRHDKLLNKHPLEDVKQYKTIANDYINAYLDYVKLTRQPRKNQRKN